MSEVAGLREGDLFAGKYVVERLLKAGGMGAVYVARNRDTGRRVALKLMLRAIVADPTMRARFAQEAQIAAMIDSPGIVDVYDAGIDAGTGVPFLVMELLRGRELGDVLHDRLAQGLGPFPPADVATFIAQTARVLDKAHAANVVHRDLKPENLFLAESEGEPSRIKVLDFGIAKIVSHAAAATQAGGTPQYMAPEQTSRGEITPAADIWALGLVAYTLLVGAHYWRGDSIAQLYREILMSPIDPPSQRALERNVYLPAGFDEWFAGCVVREPSARFARAGSAAERLTAILSTPMRTMLAPATHAPVTWHEPPTRTAVATVVAAPAPTPADVPPDERDQGAGAFEPTRDSAPPPLLAPPPVIPRAPSRQGVRAQSEPETGGGLLAGVPRWLIAVTGIAVVVVPIAILSDPLGKRAPKSGASEGTNASTASTPAESAPSDLVTEDVVVGDGAEAMNGKTVKVHYVGKLQDGTVFDSSRERSQAFTFALGAGEVIKGWEMGIRGMKVGGKRKLTIPPHLAYGAAGRPPKIPPSSTLVFDIELLAVP